MKKLLVTAAVTVLSLFAGACALPSGTDDPMQLAVFDAVESAWYGADMPVPDESCNLERFVVVHASAPKYWELCGSDPAKSAGCAHFEHIYPLRSGTIPYVVISPKHYVEPTIIVHELLHHFQRCTTGRDFNHADPQVWSAAGGPTSIQAKATDLLLDGGWL